jgi:hypothetical protein
VLEGFTEFYRRFEIRTFSRKLDIAISEGNPLPPAKNLYDLAQGIGALDDGEVTKADFFTPNFERFDTGERFRQPIEVNQAILARPLVDKEGNWLIEPTWVFRTHGTFADWGYIMERKNGYSLQFTSKSKDLGWR